MISILKGIDYPGDDESLPLTTNCNESTWIAYGEMEMLNSMEGRNVPCGLCTQEPASIFAEVLISATKLIIFGERCFVVSSSKQSSHIVDA